MAEPRIINGGLAVDDRGQLSFLNDLGGFKIKRFYMVENHRQGFVRAWHGHRKERKLVFVTQGAALLRAIKMDTEDVSDEGFAHVLSGQKPQAFYIPNGYYNGFKTLTQDTKVIFFSDRTLEESKDDDFRKPFDHFGLDIWNIKQR
jgi:dTDP-4-dehydrorhamnose 3,5-epimerase